MASEPIGHKNGTTNFTCPCGVVLTFCPNTHTYTPLQGLETVAPRVMRGSCPFCGRLHWRGQSVRSAESLEFQPYQFADLDNTGRWGRR